MRLFFAIELSAEVQAALGRLQPAGAAADYRWSDPSKLHVTLAFLGEQPPDSLGRLEVIGTAAARTSRPAMLRLGEPGAFGGRAKPRVLWIGLDGDVNALLALQKRLIDGLREAGFPVEDRPFQAHVTLARRRETARSSGPVGWPPASVDHAPFPMGELVLFQSQLSPRGATYTPLLRLPLGP